MENGNYQRRTRKEKQWKKEIREEKTEKIHQTRTRKWKLWRLWDLEFRCRFLEYSDSEDEAEMEIKQDLNTIKDKEKS